MTVNPLRTAIRTPNRFPRQLDRKGQLSLLIPHSDVTITPNPKTVIQYSDTSFRVSSNAASTTTSTSGSYGITSEKTPLTRRFLIWQAMSKPLPMPSHRTSAGQAAEKPPSLAASLTKSKNASSKKLRTAEEAAARAFTRSKSLPFQAGATQSTGMVEEGRSRLKGAYLIRADRIVPDPQQPRKRIDPTYLEELTASVKRLGILQPIVVRYVESENQYRIIAGECRFSAAGKAGLTEIPCWVKSPDAEEVLLQQIAENWQRSDLHPFDLAAGAVVVANESNVVSGPAADHRVLFTRDRPALAAATMVSVVIASTSLTALPQKQREDRSVRIGCPLPQLRNLPHTPRTHEFSLVYVHSGKVLTHDDEIGKEIRNV